MSERNWRRRFHPLTVFASENMNGVIHAAGNVKLFAVRTPGNSHKCVWHLQYLFFDRSGMTDVVDKHVFIRQCVDYLAIRSMIAVEPAGEHQKRLAVGTNGARNRMIGRELRQFRQSRTERLQCCARRRQGRDAHACGQELGLSRWCLHCPALESEYRPSAQQQEYKSPQKRTETGPRNF